MLTRGNAKLGRRIWGFSIPAAVTCPGRSHLCDENCYAQQGFFRMPNVKEKLWRNYELSQRDDFPLMMRNEIEDNKVEIVRIHVAGDFYDLPYVKKWHQIVANTPDITYFVYTRSWRKIPETQDMRKSLIGLSRYHNMNMWWSVDDETGFPDRVPKRVRTAYMSLSGDDLPHAKSDLVFRDYAVRDLPQKYHNGVLVCPQENGITHFDCFQCGICWKAKPTPRRKAEQKRRVNLPVTV